MAYFYMTRDKFSYKPLEDGGAEILGYHKEISQEQIRSDPDSFRALNFPMYCANRPVTSIGLLGVRGVHRVYPVIYLPPTVTRINRGAFRSPVLERINIPDKVTDTTSCPFRSCPKLKRILVSDNHPTLLFENGMLTDKEKTTLIYDTNAAGAEHYTVPEGFQKIAAGAFAGCPMKSLTIPEGITQIGKEAFDGCESLAEIRLPASLRSIGDRAFVSCSALESIVIPEGVTEIGDEAFYLCKSLADVRLPAGLRTIGYMAFGSCIALESIVFPSTLEHLGMSAFRNCGSLKKVVFAGGLRQILRKRILYGHNTFHGCPVSRSLTLLPQHLMVVPLDIRDWVLRQIRILKCWITPQKSNIDQV